MPHDIFISYRRESGSETARLLCSELIKRGHSAFLDVEDLKQGHFDDALLQHIESARNFVVILSPGALERCANEGDWLRREIGHALRTNRNVVPVLMPGCHFPPPEQLPEDIRGVVRHNGVVYSHEHFSDTMAQICSYLGPSAGSGATRKRWRGRLLLWTAAAVVVIGLVVAITLNLQTHANERFLKDVAIDIANQLIRMNIELGRVEDTTRQAKQFFTGSRLATAPGQTNELAAWAQHCLEEQDRITLEPYWTEARGQRLQELGLPAQDAHALYRTELPLFWSEVRKFYQKTAYYASLPSQAWLKEQARVSELSAELLTINAESMYFGVLGLLSHFPPRALDGFEKLRPQMTRFPDVWAINEKEADARMEKAINRLQEKVMALTVLVGNEDINIQTLQANATQLGKMKAALGEMETTLSETGRQLAASKARLREKCKLEPGESPWLMWGKILRLRTAGLNEDAVTSLDRYLELNKTNEPAAVVYVPSAKAFFQKDSAMTNSLGVLVVAFENQQPHSVLQVGDIVLRRNGAPLSRVDDSVAAAKTGIERYEYLRLQSDASFRRMEAESSPKDPRIGVIDLREETSSKTSKGP